MFKINKYDKEDSKYKQGCQDTERLLQNLDGLSKTCRHQIKQKNQKIRELKQRIKKKEEALFTKQQEFSRLTMKAAQSSSSPKVELDKIKEELRILRNEKLTLEECEQDCKNDVKKLNKSIRNLKKRNHAEAEKVKALEKEVGKVTENCKNEIQKHSVVENSMARLKTLSQKEKETKDKFLLEVTHKKNTMYNNRYLNTDSKTMRAEDWNKIEDEDSSCVSNTKVTMADGKSLEESKVKNSVNETDSQVEVSFISFDPDCDSTQSD